MIDIWEDVCCSEPDMEREEKKLMADGEKSKDM